MTKDEANGRLVRQLEILRACDEALRFVEQKRITTIRDAILKCKRPDWVLWLARQLDVPQEHARKAVSACLRHAIQYLKPPDHLRKPMNAALRVFATDQGEKLNAALTNLSNAVHDTYGSYRTFLAEHEWKFCELADACENLWGSGDKDWWPDHPVDILINILSKTHTKKLFDIVLKHVSVARLDRAWKKRFD